MKTCLITGATAGIGAASARAFVGAGWRVIGTGRREERLKALQEELGASFLQLAIDMQDLEQVGTLVDHRADQQPAVGPARDRKLVLAGDAFLLEPLADRDEVVEHILLVGEAAAVVPCLAIFAAAANVPSGVKVPTCSS